MSDYWPSTDAAISELPLFAAAAKPITAMHEQAKAFHQSELAQRQTLERLRTGTPLTKQEYEQSFADGRRLAPAVEQLRKAHGLLIDGIGTSSNPYKMLDAKQRPTLARVTTCMKNAYYTLPHWYRVKDARQARDSHKCVLCWSQSDLRCHHISYRNLFNEPLQDLMTVCDICHKRIHEDCRLKFPSGVSVQYAHWLGWKGFEEWLLP